MMDIAWLLDQEEKEVTREHMKAHRGQQANAPPTRYTFVLQGSYKAR